MEHQGSFSIQKWDEDVLTERDEGVKTTQAIIKQAYEGAMAGGSEVAFLMSYQSSAQAVFTGFESFVGAINGLRGSVTFQHSGRFDNGIASSEFVSIPASTTGELSGKHITGRFTSGEAGIARYEISVSS